MVAGQHHAVQVLRELVRIGVGLELPLGNAGPEHCGDHVEQVALVAHQSVAHRAGLIVEFARRGHERASPGRRVPPQPAVDQLAHARLAARRAQDRPGDFLLEPLASLVQSGPEASLRYRDLGLPPLGAAARRFGDPAIPDDEVILTLDAVSPAALLRYCLKAARSLRDGG